MNEDLSDPAKDVDVVDNVDDGFYELLVGGERVGVLVYSARDGRRVITHTAIAAEHRGRGHGDYLIRAAVDDLRGKNLTATNFCPAVDRFLADNHEYDDMIDRSHPGLWTNQAGPLPSGGRDRPAP